MSHWADKGWVNAQQCPFEKLSKSIQPTCKNKTVKDRIFLSPQLAMHLCDVHVCDSYFPDHAVLWVELSSLGKPPKVPVWRTPKPIDWSAVPTLEDLGLQILRKHMHRSCTLSRKQSATLCKHMANPSCSLTKRDVEPHWM